MKILITGVAGFIGQAVAIKLLLSGHSVVGIDSMCGTEELLALKQYRIERILGHRMFRFIKYDLSNDLSPIMNIVSDTDIIIHLAASTGVRESMIKPELFIKNNIEAFLNIIKLATELSVSHFIYASSSSVYGNCEISKCGSQEDQAQTGYPQSIYAMTKRSNELMAYVYSANYKLKTTGLRFFSVYGPCGRQDMAPWIFAESLLTNKSITLYNRGEMYRDFTFIDDIVDSIERVVVSERQSMNEVYNIGNSNPHSIIELVHLIEQEYKSESTIIEESVIPGDVLQTHACMSKFKRDYNKDNFVDFAVGVNSFCIWLKEYLLFSSGLIGLR